jgi:hypothetical protein
MTSADGALLEGQYLRRIAEAWYCWRISKAWMVQDQHAVRPRRGAHRGGLVIWT